MIFFRPGIALLRNGLCGVPICTPPRRSLLVNAMTKKSTFPEKRGTT